MKKHLPKPSIPRRTVLEDGLPIEELYEFAKREGNAKKPIYEIHKWWARRLGHVFRFLLISATTKSLKRIKKRQHRALLRKFYQRNNLGGLVVLDPFMGGGTSVVEALKCGARVIGVDIDPVAWFVTSREIAPFDETAVRESFEVLEKKLARKLRQLYSTTDPDTGKAAEIVNAFWVSRFRCPDCSSEIDAHPHYRLTFSSRTEMQTVFCKHCASVHKLPLSQKWFKCKSCAQTTVIMRGQVHKGVLKCPCGRNTRLIELIREGRPARKHLFGIEYSLQADRGAPERRFKQADASDLRKFRSACKQFQAAKAELLYPESEIIADGRFDRRPTSHGYKRYDQLFNDRQLLCLSKILKEILALKDRESREYLLLAFSDCLASNNILCSYAFGYQKVTPLFAIHAYQVPQRPVEGNVWGNPHFGRGSFSRCVAKLITGKRYALQPFEYRYLSGDRIERVVTKEQITTKLAPSLDSQSNTHRATLLNQSSVDLSRIRDNSVDLILTDPPFYNNLPYSELSDFYHQWLRLYFQNNHAAQHSSDLYTPVNETLLVRRRTEQEHKKYASGLLASMCECARVLKTDGMMVFTFHHREPAAWHALASALLATKFKVTGICPVRAEGVSGFHSYAGTPKWDSVICCRPRKQTERNVVLFKQLCTEADIGKKLKIIDRCSSKWATRILANKMPWNSADEASFAYSLALEFIVNEQTTPKGAKLLLDSVTAAFPQHGVANALPEWFFTPNSGLQPVA
jgi:putative DNA methylase